MRPSNNDDDDTGWTCCSRFEAGRPRKQGDTELEEDEEKEERREEAEEEEVGPNVDQLCRGPVGAVGCASK